jgi:hypothetical protein
MKTSQEHVNGDRQACWMGIVREGEQVTEIFIRKFAGMF